MSAIDRSSTASRGDGDVATKAEGGGAPTSVTVLMRSVGLATVLPVVLSVVGAPLLARAMDPSDRGRLAGLLAAATIANTIALGGAPHQLPKDLARLSETEVWARVVAAVRRLRIGMLATAIGMAVVSTVVWPGSWLQTSLIAVFLAVWWLLGIERGTLSGIGDHRRVTTSFLVESGGRLVGILILVVGWSRIDATLGLLMVGLFPTTTAVLVAAPRMLRLRRAARADRTADTGPVTFAGYAAFSVGFTQQLMGRSVLSLWALVMTDENLGYFAIAFAVTELTVNFARIAQPFVIRRVQGGHSSVWPWIAVTSSAAAATALLGLVVVIPLFGDEYAPAVSLVVPLAVAQAMFSIVVFETGVRFVVDPRAMIRGVRRWQTLSVLATIATALFLEPIVVAWVFAVVASLQAAASIRANRATPVVGPGRELAS